MSQVSRRDTLKHLGLGLVGAALTTAAVAGGAEQGGSTPAPQYDDLVPGDPATQNALRSELRELRRWSDAMRDAKPTRPAGCQLPFGTTPPGMLYRAPALPGVKPPHVPYLRQELTARGRSGASGLYGFVVQQLLRPLVPDWTCYDNIAQMVNDYEKQFRTQPFPTRVSSPRYGGDIDELQAAVPSMLGLERDRAGWSAAEVQMIVAGSLAIDIANALAEELHALQARLPEGSRLWYARPEAWLRREFWAWDICAYSIICVYHPNGDKHVPAPVPA